MEQINFQIMLTENYYVEPNRTHLCFPIKILKGSNANTDIDADLITLNKFFAQLVKQISMTSYGHDKQLISTFLTYEIYQHSGSILKHLLKNSFIE